MGICQQADDGACSRKAGAGHVLLALAVIGTGGYLLAKGRADEE